jgi:transcriptional/translational regulatory protein YebC/TACO1
MGRAYQNRKASMAKTSDMKAKVYSRYGREIYVCAKSGGAEPDGNLALRSLIDRAKKDQVPSHVIEKALSKAKGGGGEDFKPAIYEGYGPGGSMVMIECSTIVQFLHFDMTMKRRCLRHYWLPMSTSATSRTKME